MLTFVYLIIAVSFTAVIEFDYYFVPLALITGYFLFRSQASTILKVALIVAVYTAIMFSAFNNDEIVLLVLNIIISSVYIVRCGLYHRSAIYVLIAPVAAATMNIWHPTIFNHSLCAATWLAASIWVSYGWKDDLTQRLLSIEIYILTAFQIIFSWFYKPTIISAYSAAVSHITPTIYCDATAILCDREQMAGHNFVQALDAGLEMHYMISSGIVMLGCLLLGTWLHIVHSPAIRHEVKSSEKGQ